MPELSQNSPLPLVSVRLDALPKQRIDVAPWPMEGERPETSFTLAHGNGCLFLKYYVRESTVLAKYRNINDPVYKDSCVEFFISFGEEEPYYNLEANCLGTCLMGYGTGRHNRRLLPRETIAEIKHTANLKVAINGQKCNTWELTLVIPASVFAAHRLEQFEGLTGKVNFYKCGDDLPVPHYLAWSNIVAPGPDFHRPEHFGQLIFSSVQRLKAL